MESNEEALRLYYKAIALDPYFRSAYAAAAVCFTSRIGFGWIADRDKEFAEAKRLARRAVQSDRDDASALSAAGLALAGAGELDDGAAFLDRALLINPNLAVGWSVGGWVKIWLGEADRAIERLAAARGLVPDDPIRCR